MTESNSVRVSLVQRTDFDTAATLDMLVLRGTGQTMRNRVQYLQSQTLRTDADVQDIARVGASVSGSLPTELVFPVANEALWFLMRAALRATETAAATQVTGVTCTSSVLSGGSGNVETGVEVGDIVRVLTSADAKHGVGYFKVSAINAGTHTVTLEGSPANGASLKVLRGARMKGGTERYFYDIEVGRVDGDLYELFEKCPVDTMEITVADQAITTCNFGLLGVTSQRDAAATMCVSHTDPTAGTVMDCLGVPVFHVGGAAFSARSFGLSLANNIRARTEIGTLGTTGFSWGQRQITTRISTYIDNWDHVTNYTSNLDTDLWFVLEDAAGKALAFSIPAMKWTELGADTRGLNQDDYLEGTGQAKADSTEGCSIRMVRWV